MIAFEPTRQAALARMDAIDPEAYARTRNALAGAVTRLSPYLTHGLLNLREVYTAVHARHPLGAQHKLVFELGWRAYYRHVWAHRGDGIHASLHAGPLPQSAYGKHMPADVLQARTGIPAIDLAVRTLYKTGYLHNHARMWLASYLVHLRKVHWHVGAQWMLGYLLDGDIASNHLSWQWVAGTASVKPYLFNADNVAKYAPAAWHSPGTVIDTSYEALDNMARSSGTPTHSEAATQPASGTGMVPPACASEPNDTKWGEPDRQIADGCDVWLIHPWSLGSGPAAPTRNTRLIGIGLAECHAHSPWSHLRWRFVSEGLRTRTPHLWWGNGPQLAAALCTARSVRWQPDPHIDAALNTLQTQLQDKPVPTPAQAQPCEALFEPVSPLCRSFAQWWKQTRIAN